MQNRTLRAEVDSYLARIEVEVQLRKGIVHRWNSNKSVSYTRLAGKTDLASERGKF